MGGGRVKDLGVRPSSKLGPAIIRFPVPIPGIPLPSSLLPADGRDWVGGGVLVITQPARSCFPLLEPLDPEPW